MGDLVCWVSVVFFLVLFALGRGTYGRFALGRVGLLYRRLVLEEGLRGSLLRLLEEPLNLEG